MKGFLSVRVMDGSFDQAFEKVVKVLYKIS